MAQRIIAACWTMYHHSSYLANRLIIIKCINEILSLKASVHFRWITVTKCLYIAICINMKLSVNNITSSAVKNLIISLNQEIHPGQGSDAYQGLFLFIFIQKLIWYENDCLNFSMNDCEIRIMIWSHVPTFWYSLKRHIMWKGLCHILRY